MPDSAAGTLGIVVELLARGTARNSIDTLKLRYDIYRAKFQHEVMINQEDAYGTPG
jgi:hypothetical protein